MQRDKNRTRNNNIVNTEKSQNKISANVPEVQSFVCSDYGKSFNQVCINMQKIHIKFLLKNLGP